MEYPIGLIILLFGIYSITDLSIKARYTRKSLLSDKHKKEIQKIY